MIFAQRGVDVRSILREIYEIACADVYGEGDSAESNAAVQLVWSGAIAGDKPTVAHRVTIHLGEYEEDGELVAAKLADQLVDEIVDMPKDDRGWITAVVKLSDPVQLHGHTVLYREVYAIEMALREVVSYIFATEFPDNLIDGLAKTTVKPASTENLPQDAQLIKHGENRFFYILFDKYAILNDAPDLKAAHIAAALQGGTNLDEVREALDLRPIKEERHAGFLASLQTLMDPLERVRNAVAHNRTVPETVRENFHKAADKLREEVESFWKREAEHVESGEAPPDPPKGPDPTPAT